MRMHSTGSELISNLANYSFKRLVFPPSLEELFRADGEAFRAQRLWLEGLIAIGLYVAFLLLAWSFHEAKLWIRFALVLPLLVATNMAVLYQLIPRQQELGILLASCFAGSVEIAVHLSDTNPDASLSWLEICAVLLFVNGVMRLKRRYSVASLAWSTTAAVATLQSELHRGNRTAWMAAASVEAFGILSVVANYSQDREARIAYLKRTKSDDLVDALRNYNEMLQVAAHTDQLTGVPNRAAFAHYVGSIWTELAQTKQLCSAVMIDVDRFKQLNDRYGHPYGDRVLRRVAALLSQALRKPEDFLARFGGEEFIVLLPSTPYSIALLVAERLRQVIELAGLPALRADDPELKELSATISCGVATVYPHLYPNPETLISSADEALYHAKRSGRNRVSGNKASNGNDVSGMELR